MTSKHHSLRLNVGHIIHETAGYSRDYDFEFPELELDEATVVSNLAGTARLSRTQKGILVEVTASGNMPAECSRCLDEINAKLHTTFTELYALSEKSSDESELIVPEEGYIDLTPLIHDYLLLDYPINPLCKPDCAGLCPVCGTNHNHEDCDCTTETIDPRMAKLKDLLDNHTTQD